MERADAFEARIVFENGAYFTYQDPAKTMCIQLSDCPHWQPAKSVVSRNLPAHWNIVFYQTDACALSDEDEYFFASHRRATDGVQTFATPRRIKSMRARPNLGKVSWSVARKCVQLRQPVKRAESTLINSSVSSLNEDVSLNWFDPIEG